MKKIALILSLIFSLTANAQKDYQSNKLFHPYIGGSASIPLTVTDDIWSGIEVGVSNKNTCIGIGYASRHWQKNDSYLTFQVHRRALRIKKFELYGSLATSTPWHEKDRFVLQPGIKTVFHLEKSLMFLMQSQTVLHKRDNFKYNQASFGVGFQVTIRGNPHNN